MGEKQEKTTLTPEQLRRFACDLRLQADEIEKFARRAEELGFASGNLVCSNVRQLRGQVEMIGKNGTDKPVSKLSLEIVVTDKNGEVVAKDVVSARIPDAIQPGESRRLYFAPQYDSQLKAIWPDTATATAKVLTTD